MIILETDRLLFRQHEAADMEAYCQMEMDADVRRFVGGYPRSREDAEKRFKGALKPVKNKLGMWATVLKAENTYIGRCGIYPHFSVDGIAIPGEASLGLYIAAAYWGHGFATEAGTAFINMGFSELGINCIVTMIQVGNDASVRTIEKLGFNLISTEPGQYRSFYHYALVNPPAHSIR